MEKEIKVVWLVNIVFPEVCRELKIPEPVIGGWLYSYKNALNKFYPQIKLYIISPFEGVELKRIECEGNIHYTIPLSIGTNAIKKMLLKINNEICPEVVHIHGSEFYHSLAYINACGSQNAVLSIQGLVSVYAPYYFGGINTATINKYTTFRDIIKNETIKHHQKKFYKNGINEIKLISKMKYIAGRTSWDYANCWAINPKIHFFRCEEALRPSFYTYKWDIRKCRKYSIFLSQVSYPIKGLHKFLEALPIVLKHYPDTQVYIVGDDLTLKPAYRRLTYWNYLNSIINKLGIRNQLHFLGKLSENEMVQQYLLAHVFVCPSIIENSSNSICEAQLIGTPIVASYVGGTMDLIEDGKNGLLYRFEETAMLAQKICSIFENTEKACDISEYERMIATKRHDRKSIADSLYHIYMKIKNENKY